MIWLIIVLSFIILIFTVIQIIKSCPKYCNMKTLSNWSKKYIRLMPKLFFGLLLLILGCLPSFILLQVFLNYLNTWYAMFSWWLLLIILILTSLLLLLFICIKLKRKLGKPALLKGAMICICVVILPSLLYPLYYSFVSDNLINQIDLKDHKDVINFFKETDIEWEYVYTNTVGQISNTYLKKTDIKNDRKMALLAKNEKHVIESIWSIEGNKQYFQNSGIQDIDDMPQKIESYFRDKYDVYVNLDTNFHTISLAAGLCLLFFCYHKVIVNNDFGNHLLIVAILLIIINPILGNIPNISLHNFFHGYFLGELDFMDIALNAVIQSITFIIAVYAVNSPSNSETTFNHEKSSSIL